MSDSTKQALFNEPASEVSYFTPAQVPPAGVAVDPQPNGVPIPTLFQPIKIRGAEFHNRIWLSPMCQYSTKGGMPNAWHMVHLGSILTRGPGLTMVESTAILPEGRISPEDVGIWNDEQVRAWSEITAFAHAQNQKIGVQLAHAGRKASTVAPWLSFSGAAGRAQDGWPGDVVAPSAVAHDPAYHMPKALTEEGIEKVKQAFVDAAKRSVKAGFDVVEIHVAHGYLLHQFVTPIANKRTDRYGGSFENRIRLVLEVVDAVRAVIPLEMPLFMRLNGSDMLEKVLPNEPSWRVGDAARLATIVASRGVDLIDVSAGGVHPLQYVRLHREPGRPKAYQAYLSAHIRKVLNGRALVTTVGGITDGHIAQGVLDSGWADAVFVGRQFQKNPGTVWQFADDLAVAICQARQHEWGFFSRGEGRQLMQALLASYDTEPKARL